MKATAHIFLSYARQDLERVESLYDNLAAAGFKPWMDTKDILPGENWEASIQRAIRESDFFLACLSANSVGKRGFVQKELRGALEIWREKLEDDIYLIPVRIEESEVPESLRTFQWVDLFRADGWERLENAIRVGMQRRLGIAPEKRSTPSNSLQSHQRPYSVTKERSGNLVSVKHYLRWVLLAVLAAGVLYALYRVAIFGVWPPTLSPAFLDNFLDGKRAWDAPESWQVERGKRMLITGSEKIGWLRDKTYADFRAVFYLQLVNRKSAIWFIRAQDDSNYYMFQLLGPDEVSEGTFRSSKCSNGKLQILHTMPVVQGLGHADGRVIITIEAKGRKITHWIEVPSHGDPQAKELAEMEDGSFRYGKVGFKADPGAEFYIFSISIEPSEDKLKAELEGH